MSTYVMYRPDVGLNYDGVRSAYAAAFKLDEGVYGSKGASKEASLVEVSITDLERNSEQKTL